MTIFPTVYALVNSLYSFNLVQPQLGHRFVGLGNYINLFQDQRFYSSLLVTVEYVVFAVLIECVLGLGLALLLAARRAGMLARTLQGMLLVPTMIAPIIVGYVGYLLLNTETGVLTYYLNRLGPLHGLDILGSPNLALPALIGVDVWEWTPFAALIFFAGLQNQPLEVLEAAQVDGASGFNLLRYVKLPLLQSSVATVLLFRLVDALRLIDVPFVLTGGGPGSSTETWGLYIYEQAFTRYNMGYAMALGFVMMVTTVVLATLLLEALFQRR